MKTRKLSSEKPNPIAQLKKHSPLRLYGTTCDKNTQGRVLADALQNLLATWNWVFCLMLFYSYANIYPIMYQTYKQAISVNVVIENLSNKNMSHQLCKQIFIITQHGRVEKCQVFQKTWWLEYHFTDVPCLKLMEMNRK